MAKKRILVFSIPNQGHLNILKKMFFQYKGIYEFRLVLVDQKNSPPSLGDINVPTNVLKSSSQFKNTPADKVFFRVVSLLDECLEVAKSFKPDLIIYDFPALEGYCTAKILNIPYWCSIPGMIGPFIHKQYLLKSLGSKVNRRALLQLKNKYGIIFKRGDVEVISNCLHIPGQVNLLWSYASLTPRDFINNRKPANYKFVGYLPEPLPKAKKTKAGRRLIYISLGTEVMDNLWQVQSQTRAGVRKIIAGLAKAWTKEDVEVVFITQGKSVLKKYPANWTVKNYVNQQEVLSKAGLFITHGGSNSFHEAVLFKVPMLIIPFFGDQPLVARQAEAAGIGINLVKDPGIETGKTKIFLNDALVKNIFKAADGIWMSKARKNYMNLDLKCSSLSEIFKKRLSANH